MGLHEVGWGMDWIGLAQDRDLGQAVVNKVINVRIPQNAGNFLTSGETGIFSRRTLLHAVSYINHLLVRSCEMVRDITTS
jgi:hypothetical protein